MYKIIETENQDYIFFPYTLAIFPYDEKVKVAMQCNRNNDLKSDDDAVGLQMPSHLSQ